MSEQAYWLGFSAFPGVGPAKFSLLLKNFGSAKEAWHAIARCHLESRWHLEKILGKETLDRLIDFQRKFSIEDYEKKLRKNVVSFVTLNDDNYPRLLKQINRPPFVLYVKGNFCFDDSNHRNAIAVVGTRRITQYGRDVSEILTRELVAAGFTIVSGLAMGVDAVAHQTALDCGGKTIAVLGCGVDCITPLENQNLYYQILDKGGCVISELPLGHLPTKGSFPARNRIIAGLSQGVLVTEGAEDSGSLITASNAASLHRPVFAVPGPITSSLSKGPYKLISRGAKLVITANDIISELGVKAERIRNYESGIKKGETKEEEIIIKILENEPLNFDEIVRLTKFDSAKLGGVLSIMEMKGLIKSIDGGNFSIAS